MKAHEDTFGEKSKGMSDAKIEADWADAAECREELGALHAELKKSAGKLLAVAKGLDPLFGKGAEGGDGES